MEKALLAFLDEMDRWKDIVISSFDHKLIRRIKLAQPKAKVGLLYAANLIDHAAYAKQLGVDVFSLHSVSPLYRHGGCSRG